MKTTRQRLSADLMQAYLDARRNKGSKPYVIVFERNLGENLSVLCEELLARTYQLRPSSCFIIKDPKTREVFAADFRDRIVHHLYYNYTHRLFERTFIADSYSCIEGRGIHYGVNRLRTHILQESQNYREDCHVLKMDIRGYFMHISRAILYDTVISTLHCMSSHQADGMYLEEGTGGGKPLWRDVQDMEFLEYLSDVFILSDPVEGCRRIGNIRDWDSLPSSKSLFHSPPGCGLPIGNLTSQLYSNVYLNILDQFAKRELHCRHYGRYVDDFYVVSSDLVWLRSLVPLFRQFLEDRLSLSLSEEKTIISDVRNGVEFPGAYILPGRTYVRDSTVGRMRVKMAALSNWAHRYDDGSVMRFREIALHLQNALSSYCGIMAHWDTYRIRKTIMTEEFDFSRWGRFDPEITKFIPWPI